MGVVSTSCSKDDEAAKITGEALFTYVADGMIVTFTNQSDVSGVVTYAWTFGDDETSTEKDPVHTYALKGEYTVTLTVTDAQAGTHPVSTKVKVDKKTRINLTDGSFADWDAVTEEKFIMSTGGDLAGIVTSAKVDYDANYVYMLVEFTGTVEYGFFFDVYLDNDNDTLTGSKGWIWPVMGADYLVEGQFSVPTTTDFTSFYFDPAAAQDAWAWLDDKPFPTGYMVVGNIANNGRIGSVEVGFKRDKVTGLSNDLIEIAVFLSDPVSWADVGYAPNKSGDVTRGKGWLIDMR
jgi:PKD repeat protein